MRIGTMLLKATRNLSRSILLTFFVMAVSVPVSAAELIVMTEHNPPFNFEENGWVGGLSTDIFLEMARIANVPVTRDDVVVWPWARAYEEVQNNPDAILFSTARTDHREHLFQWIGPIITLKCSFIARKDAKVMIEDLSRDLSNYTIGTIRESAPEQVLIKNGVAPEQLQRVHHLNLNVKKLVEGRVDALLFNESAIMYDIKQMNLNPDDYEVVHTLMTAPLYYVAGRDMDPAIVQRLQDALDEMVLQGKTDEIINKYR